MSSSANLSSVEKYSNNPSDLGSTPFEKIKPSWWKNDHSNMVLNNFKNLNSLNIDTVKQAILTGVHEGMAELNATFSTYHRDFDAHLFHTIINESGESHGIQDKDLIMKIFETADVETDGNLLCAWATVEQKTDSYRRHYVLKVKNSNYRCISCGETQHILRYQTMTEQYKQAKGGEEKAKEARDKLIQGFAAVQSGTQSETVMRSTMLKAGVWDAHNPPPGTAL